MFWEKGVLRNFAKFIGKHLYQSLFSNKVAGAACNFIKKETLAQVFSCEFCEISKNTFFYRTPLVTASDWMGKNREHCREMGSLSCSKIFINFKFNVRSERKLENDIFILKLTLFLTQWNDYLEKVWNLLLRITLTFLFLLQRLSSFW